eukprot:PhM_4_TR8408/c4_g2_i15/m.59214
MAGHDTETREREKELERLAAALVEKQKKLVGLRSPDPMVRLLRSLPRRDLNAFQRHLDACLQNAKARLLYKKNSDNDKMSDSNESTNGGNTEEHSTTTTSRFVVHYNGCERLMVVYSTERRFEIRPFDSMTLLLGISVAQDLIEDYMVMKRVDNDMKSHRASVTFRLDRTRTERVEFDDDVMMTVCCRCLGLMGVIEDL